MVSLFSLSEVTEEGVRFSSPYDGEETLLSPERSVEIQNALGKRALPLPDVCSLDRASNATYGLGCLRIWTLLPSENKDKE